MTCQSCEERVSMYIFGLVLNKGTYDSVAELAIVLLVKGVSVSTRHLEGVVAICATADIVADDRCSSDLRFGFGGDMDVASEEPMVVLFLEPNHGGISDLSHIAWIVKRLDAFRMKMAFGQRPCGRLYSFFRRLKISLSTP